MFVQLLVNANQPVSWNQLIAFWACRQRHRKPAEAQTELQNSEVTERGATVGVVTSWCCDKLV